MKELRHSALVTSKDVHPVVVQESLVGLKRDERELLHLLWIWIMIVASEIESTLNRLQPTHMK